MNIKLKYLGKKHNNNNSKKRWKQTANHDFSLQEKQEKKRKEKKNTWSIMAYIRLHSTIQYKSNTHPHKFKIRVFFQQPPCYINERISFVIEYIYILPVQSIFRCHIHIPLQQWIINEPNPFQIPSIGTNKEKSPERTIKYRYQVIEYGCGHWIWLIWIMVSRINAHGI